MNLLGGHITTRRCWANLDVEVIVSKLVLEPRVERALRQVVMRHLLINPRHFRDWPLPNATRLT